MLFTLQEACNILHVDVGVNDNFITALVLAIPDYISVTTGLSPYAFSSEPLVKTVGGFILTLWYYADHADDVALKRTIDNLLKCISLRARDYE